MLLLLPLPPPPPPPPPPLPPPSSCCLCPPLPLPAIAPVSSLPPTPACRRSQGTYVTEGVHPPGSMWAMIPVPSQALGPRCIAGTNDTNSTPHACEPWEQGLVEGPCKPCPGTAGSDCSRCDNWWHGQTSCAAVSNPKLARRAAAHARSFGPHRGCRFPPPCKGCAGGKHDQAIRDVVKVPATLQPGKYVLGWRWDCEATAQVWSNCADIELVA